MLSWSYSLFQFQSVPIHPSSNNKKNGKPTKPAGIPIFIRTVNPPTESDPPILNMNPANQEPQPLDERQVLKESHAQESCKLTSLQAEVMLIKSSLAEMLDMMKQPGSFSNNNVRFLNPPGVPFIYTRVLKTSLPANSKTLVEVQQEPGAPP